MIGKSSRRLAYVNQIPAVVYGPGRDPQSIAVNRHDFELWLAHHSAGSAVIELKLEGEKKPLHAMIREVHHSPVKGNVLHIDFLVVSMDKVTSATVPLHFINDPAGVKAGGVLTINVHEVNLEAKPADIPVNGIELDVAALEIGDSLHVSDLVVGAGVTITDDPETIVVAVQAPRAEEPEETAETAAEPEVIGAKDQSE
jgi:large subunit ribosomal protein L25